MFVKPNHSFADRRRRLARSARNLGKFRFPHQARRLDLEAINFDGRARPRVVVFAAVIFMEFRDRGIERV